MLTAAERERRAILVENGLAHYGACACGVGAKGTEARLYKCQHCAEKVCFGCKAKHACGEVVHE